MAVQIIKNYIDKNLKAKLALYIFNKRKYELAIGENKILIESKLKLIEEEKKEEEKYAEESA